MASLVLLVVVTLCRIRQLTAYNYNAELALKMDQNKVLHGHSFLNISGITMENCLERCLKNCSCMSFQICHDTRECQLCSSNRYLDEQAMHQRQGCTNYDFGSQKETEVGNQQCGQSTATVFNCCMTSNPCLNGGTCLPALSSNGKRFRCKCPHGYTGEQCDQCKPGYTGEQCEVMLCKPGYTGEKCEHPIRSCRGYSNGTRILGNYTVFDANNKTFMVFCDFDKNSSMTWTLIQSYSLLNNNDLFNRNALYIDFPQNQNVPSWLKYRLSKSRMESIQRDSTKWRVTCRYETDGVVYRDYLRGSNTQLDILIYDKDECVTVEYVDVRGHNCTDCSVYMRQTTKKMLHILVDIIPVSVNCFFEASREQLYCYNNNTVSAYYFGHYYCKNTEHRCSSSNNATTQTWFGED